ncbi:MAG: sodium-dependent bicarbonate transport family permease [Thermoanaerobaculia bacterium]|nr:sodium-dependent bicarbonate transport family permease [Thermoanaerobaculia bacterium]
MDFSSIVQNVVSPAFLFFFLGFGAVLLKSDLEIPHPLPKFFSLYLLLSIGYTGGEKLAHAGLAWSVALYIAVAMLMALAVPFYTFFVLRRILSVYDAAAMAATYGSISIVTFIVGTEFLTRLSEPYGGYMVAIMSLMESPAVIMGILLVRLFAPRGKDSPERPGIGHLLKESILNGTVYLLLGSLVVGVLTGNSAGKGLEPFTVGIFKGMVLFFLLDTGMLAARRAKTLLKVGPKLVLFGIGAPLLNGAVGVLLAWAMGMGRGDALLFAILCASSSYIVVPAAMRQAVPEANPGLFELLSLSVTFPFNISVGIPLYWGAIRLLIG